MILKYMSIHLKSKLQYRLSFIFITISQLMLILMSLIVMYSLFDRFGGIKGFTLYEALISFSVVQLGYSISEIFFRGFDSFSKLIKAGTFDLLLIKPRNIYLQIIGSNIGYEKTGRTLGSLMILLYALSKVEIYESNLRLLLLIPMVIS
jgi:ABC-2 type transport system permease protein